jgi:cyanophycinase
MSVFLVGGGPGEDTGELLDAFRAEVGDRAPGRTRGVVAALFDVDGSADFYLPSYAAALVGIPLILVRLGPGHTVDPSVFADADGIVIGGGPTPEYRDALIYAAPTIRTAVGVGVPYLGFSAGAMVAAEHALVGGYELNGHEVCPVEWSEDLDAVTLLPGLGLVPFVVDSHAAQGGTLGRSVALVETGLADAVAAIDEGTCLRIRGQATPLERGQVTGRGAVWLVRGPAPVTVARLTGQ